VPTGCASRADDDKKLSTWAILVLLTYYVTFISEYHQGKVLKSLLHMDGSSVKEVI